MNTMLQGPFRAILAVIILVCLDGGFAVAKTVEGDMPTPGEFTTAIDNPFWPLPVSSTFAYMAETEDGCEYSKVTITGATTEVDGYTTLIIRDQEWESEECEIGSATLVEDTNDYYAMEVSSKNVWYLGEHTWAVDEDSEYCTDDGAWLAGEDGAEAGIIMLGDPQSGDRYQQEYWEGEAEDWGAVLRLNARVSIDFDDYEDCLVTREWTPLEPGSVEHKYYCPQYGNPGPGLVYISELKERTVHVEYIGPGFDGSPPGEFDDFPALETVGSCLIP